MKQRKRDILRVIAAVKAGARVKLAHRDRVRVRIVWKDSVKINRSSTTRQKMCEKCAGIDRAK